MQLKDESIWKQMVETNSKEEVGREILRYAVAWADLMEQEIAQGKDLKDIADVTSHEADTNGISGAMFGFAVYALAKCWIYGDTLRKWNNAQLGVESNGTANLATGTIYH